MTMIAELALEKTRSRPPAPAISTDIRSYPLEALIREGRCSIGPALATRVLIDAHYDGQRPLAKHHITLLAEDMRRDRWTSGSQLCFGRLKGGLYLINGRHRMTAIAESQREIEFQVLILDVATEAELSALYYRFDRRQRARSDAEVLNALGFAETHGLSKGMTKAVFDAALIIANNFRRPNYQADPVAVRSDDARLETASSWWSFGARYEALIKPAPVFLKHKLMVAQVVAVGLVTCRYQPELATTFWGGLALNDGLRRTDPRNTLIGDLQTRNLLGSKLNGAIVTSSAWNAHYQGRQASHFKVMDGSVTRIVGTPYDGRRA